jgi:ADP-ribose pyrophosphatase YjhB (NUDIX family)
MITCHFEDSKKPAYLRHVVVDMLVVKGNKILLAKRSSKYLETGKWALPGGYLDINETTQQAAIRETTEETGYQTEITDLFRINDSPKRPREKNRQSVALIYLMKPLKKTGEPDHEIDQVKWFNLDKLPQSKDIAFDHHQTIELYKKYLSKTFKLPILG